MTKDDFFDLIVKGFGVYLLVLAIMQLPSVIKAVFFLINLFFTNFPDDTDNVQVSLYLTCLSGIFKFIIYVFVSVNFLRNGSLVKKFMGKKKSDFNDEQNN